MLILLIFPSVCTDFSFPVYHSIILWAHSQDFQSGFLIRGDGVHDGATGAIWQAPYSEIVSGHQHESQPCSQGLQYDLLKTPLISALGAYNSKTNSVTPIFYYRIVIIMIRCNFLQSLKKFCEGGSEPP